mgnify:CR=1 FL=1
MTFGLPMQNRTASFLGASEANRCREKIEANPLFIHGKDSLVDSLAQLLLSLSGLAHPALCFAWIAGLEIVVGAGSSKELPLSLDPGMTTLQTDNRRVCFFGLLLQVGDTVCLLFQFQLECSDLLLCLVVQLPREIFTTASYTVRETIVHVSR